MITDTMIDNIENKKENLRLQEYFLINKPFWKLVISLKICMKQRQQLQDYVILKT